MVSVTAAGSAGGGGAGGDTGAGSGAAGLRAGLRSGTDRNPLFDRALVAEAVLLVLLPEAVHARLDHSTRRVPETAQTPPTLEAGLDPVQQLQVHLAALARQDALVGAHRPIAAHAARRALAARL